MAFSFGTPSSAPATGMSGGFSFGANKPATPGFGLGATTQPSGGLFGTPATSAPAFGSTATPAFGSTAAPAFGSTAAPAFGSTAAPAFGTTPAPAFGTTPAPAFGTTPAPAFGTTPAPAFGTTPAPAFGTNPAPAFGTTPAPAFGTTSTAPTFSSGLGTGGLNFGAGSNTTTSSGLGTLLSTPATTASTGLGLGGFGFGALQTTQNTGFGLLGATSTTTTTSSLFGSTVGTTNATSLQTSSTVTPSVGLGGPVTSGIGVASTNATDSKDQQPKQAKLPNELLTLVDGFKEHVKKQKALSTDIMRVSIKPLHKVSREAEETLRTALSLSGDVGKARAQSRRLRSAAAKALAAAELAASDLPGSELEGSAPPAYIKDLIVELEQQVITFRRQMDEADKQMQATPKVLSEQEVTMGIRRMHESLVALASRLQTTHAQVEAQKEQYLNLRKYILKDPTNVFEDHPQNTLDQLLRDAEGTKKKTKLLGYSDINHGTTTLPDPRAALGSVQHLAGPSPFSYLGNTISPYPNADTGSSWYQPQQAQSMNVAPTFNHSGFLPTTTAADSSSSVTFQLQKPPKRGKQ